MDKCTQNKPEIDSSAADLDKTADEIVAEIKKNFKADELNPSETLDFKSQKPITLLETIINKLYAENGNCKMAANVISRMAKAKAPVIHYSMDIIHDHAINDPMLAGIKKQIPPRNDIYFKQFLGMIFNDKPLFKIIYRSTSFGSKKRMAGLLEIANSEILKEFRKLFINDTEFDRKRTRFIEKHKGHLRKKGIDPKELKYRKTSPRKSPKTMNKNNDTDIEGIHNNGLELIGSRPTMETMSSNPEKRGALNE